MYGVVFKFKFTQFNQVDGKGGDGFLAKLGEELMDLDWGNAFACNVVVFRDSSVFGIWRQAG